MDDIFSNFLIYSSINRGAYVLFNYIGQLFKLSLFRITVTTISLIINVLYLVLYGYIAYTLYTNNLVEGFYHDRKAKMVTALIATILIVVVFLLSYFSMNEDYDFCKNVVDSHDNNSDSSSNNKKLYYLDKVINLVYLLWIFSMIIGIVQSRAELKAGKVMVAAKLYHMLGSIVVSSLMIILKSIQLGLLLENKEFDKKQTIKDAVINDKQTKSNNKTVV